MVIILLVIMLIFGAKRLPEIGSSLGRSIRTFKSAVTGEDEKPENGQAVQPKTSDDKS
jgi:sec-independent protein translocase protein TatA